MSNRRIRCAAGLILLGLSLGCATRFSPAMIRDEIALQRGQDPLGVFELNLGRFTTLLLKSALAGQNGDMPFAGLEQLQMAVYEAPSDNGPAIDVTRIAVRGWEPVIRSLDDKRSAMVLIRSAGENIGDLVIVGGGPRNVIYARLRGRLSRDLPSALGDVLRNGGPDEMRRMLTEIGEGGR